MPKITEHIVRHADGSIWGRGSMQGKVPVGKWVWFRKNGTKMRSGTFKHGKQVGEWVTYDKTGRVVKKTVFKEK